MYNHHFGFRENPFKLVPNPEYLYLSKIHEIALAHLAYAVEQGDGFVVITGEVGTGKTTLCRMFLEQLDETTESAYIFNPRLDSVELLTTICNEFGIHTNHSSLKQLLDVINGYLIMKSKANRKVILLIDEAQNLSIENLEMVRMLSNLETTRNKLIQIILVGQPELGDKLDSYELRQLSQRISLTTHLTPLGLNETVGYIQHRVNIAAQRHLVIFNNAACKQIHKYSKGTPRMINIACDRALLNAYTLNQDKVTGPIAKLAVDELSSRKRKKSLFSISALKRWGAIAGAVMVVFALIWSFFIKTDADDRLPETVAAQQQPAVGDTAHVRTYKVPRYPPVDTPAAVQRNGYIGEAAVNPSVEGASAVDSAQLSNFINSIEHETSRFDAVGQLLQIWGQPAPIAAQLPTGAEDSEYIDIAAHQYGLRMYIVHSDWAMIKKMNLPAIVAFKRISHKKPVYMAMTNWSEDGHIHLTANGGQINLKVRLETILPYLKGPVYVYWKNAIGYDHLISGGAPLDAVAMAKDLLRKVGYSDLGRGAEFDHKTRHAIMDFQLRHSLEPDGLIGPLTKIFLISEANVVKAPRLNS